MTNSFENDLKVLQKHGRENAGTILSSRYVTQAMSQLKFAPKET